MTGLKVIDGTSTEISKYLREKDKIKDEIYEKYRWEIDDVNPQTVFAEFQGWMDKGVLDEKKVVRTHNEDLRKALKSQKQKIIKIIKNWSGIVNKKELLKSLGEKE